MLISHATRNFLADRLRRLLGGGPCRRQVAALPWRETDGGVQVMLITSRGTKRWIVPKGWPEDDETPCRSAEREAKEEAGIKGTVEDTPIGRYFYGKVQDSGDSLRCEVAVYPLHVEQEAERWREMKQRKRKWFAPAEAASLVDEPDLAELIRRFGDNGPRIAA